MGIGYVVGVLGGALIAHAAYATVQYRSVLKITEEEFSRPPVDVMMQLLLGLALCMWAGISVPAKFLSVLPHSEENRTMVLMKPVPDQRGTAGISHSSVLENANPHPRETDDGTLRRKFKEDYSVTLDQQPVIKKNAALIEKIGSLNNKARNVDARNVAEPFPSKEAKEKQKKSTDPKADQVIKDVPSAAAITGSTSSSGQPACVSPVPNVPTTDGAVVGPLQAHFTEVSKAGKLGESTHDRTRRRGDSSRSSHGGPAKDMTANNFAGHGRGEKSTTESSPVVDLRNTQHDQTPEHASQLPPVTVTDDTPASPDYEFQRAKMRELAVQRAKRLQAEEEERTKQQRAKALAELEELNRRASVHQKNSNDPPLEIDDMHNKQRAGLDATTKPPPASSTAESRDVTASDNHNTLLPPNDPNDTAVLVQSKSSALPHAAGAGKDPAVLSTSSSGRNTQSNMMEHVAQKSISQSHGVDVSKPRQGYSRRQAVSHEKIPGEKSSVAVSSENVKKTVEASLDTSTAVVTSHDDPPAHKKKNARNSRSKKKVDDAPAATKYSPMVLNEQNTVSFSTDQTPEHASQLPPVTVTDDTPASPDYEFQRAKMRELAVQRAKRLQAEEEERTKQQRAKALAELEELNRRASVHQKNSNDPPLEIDDMHNKQRAGLDATTKPPPASSTAESRDVTASDNHNTLLPPNDPNDTAVLVQSKSSALPHAAGAGKDPAVLSTSSSGRNTQSNMMEHVAQKSISQSHGVDVSKPRQGYSRRQAVSHEKIPGEKSSVAVSSENVKKTVEASLDTSIAVVTSHDDPPAHKKKNARNSRSKKKVDDAPAATKYSPMVLNEQNTVSFSTDQTPEHASQLPPVTVTDDTPASPDYEFQRAKMRELAVQRAKRLQAEEEERTKQQRAKALAKLEELNRRASVHQKNSNDPPLEIDDMHNKQRAGLDATTKPPPASSTAESRDVTASDNHNTLLPPNDPNDTAVLVQSKSSALPHAAGAGKDPAVLSTSSSGRNTQSNMMEHVAQKSISQSHGVDVSKPRQGYSRRQAVSHEKIPGEKSSVAVSSENVKKTVEASLDTSTAVVTSHDDPPAHKKKNARNSRSKKKVDDAPAATKYSPMVLNEQNTVSFSSEPKTQTAGVIISSSIVPTEGTVLTVGSITVGAISFGSLNQERVKSPEKAHNTANSRPRPQQANRSGKNQHAVQPVEKPHGNEGVVWALVKPSGQNEQSEEATLTTAVAARTQSVGKKTNDGENVTRRKRAEMERYVPKPLSKELQQQNLVQNLPSEKSSVENKSNDKEAAEKSTAAKADAATEPKRWEDKKTSRGHGKSHPSWRRRNTDESAVVVPNPAERAENCQESHEVQKPSDQHQPLEPDKHAGYAVGNSSVSAAKEHGAANRQRRQHVKAPKNEGINYSNENKHREGRKDVNQMSTLGMDSHSSEHRNMSRSEVKSSGAITHSRAHWKPKSSHTMGGEVDSATLQDSSNSYLAQNSSRNDEKDAQSEQCKGDMTYGDDNQKSERHKNAEQQQLNSAPRHQGHHNRRYHRGSGGYDAGKPSHVANVERQRGGTHLEYQPVGSYNKPADFQQNQSVDERSVGPPAPGPMYMERGHNRGPRPSVHFVKRNPALAPAANSYRDE